MKRRLLGRAGWRVVSVPYWEWQACSGPGEQEGYLHRLLCAADPCVHWRAERGHGGGAVAQDSITAHRQLSSQDMPVNPSGVLPPGSLRNAASHVDGDAAAVARLAVEHRESREAGQDPDWLQPRGTAHAWSGGVCSSEVLGSAKGKAKGLREGSSVRLRDSESGQLLQRPTGGSDTTSQTNVPPSVHHKATGSDLALPAQQSQELHAMVRRITTCSRAEDILLLIENDLNLMGGKEVGLAIHRLAKLAGSGSSRSGLQVSSAKEGNYKIEVDRRVAAAAAAVGRRTTDTAENLAPNDLSRLLWGFATLGLCPAPDVMETVARRITVNVDEFDAQTVVSFVWALAKIGLDPDPRVVAAMMSRAAATAWQFTTQEVLNLVWALATLGTKPGPELVVAISCRAAETASDFKPQGIAKFMWAFVKLGVDPGAHLAQAMSRSAAASARKFNAKSISMLLWSYAKLGLDPGPDLVPALSPHAIAAAGQFEPQEVAHLVWALATLGASQSPDLVRGMLLRAEEVVGELSLQEVTSLFWALGKLGLVPSPSLELAVARREVESARKPVPPLTAAWSCS
mmetsp:Transcript_53119/g.110803  ORF Transcript_53119/g.110803 Transcript_53119/m.110803 type:complete len:571 (-) Transcript_53119:17-1729(-)